MALPILRPILARGRIHQINRFYIISWDFWSSHKNDHTVNLEIFFLFINGFTSKLKWKIILLLMFKFWISLSSILEGHGTKMFNLALHTFWISSGPLSKLTTCTYSERKWNHLKSARGPLIIYSQSIWIEVRSDFQLLSRVEMRSSQICLGSTNS